MAKEKQQNVDIGTKLICEVEEEAYDLRIETCNSQLECLASISVRDTDQSISPAELISLLKKYDITDAVDLEQLAVFCTEAASGDDPQNFLLARGKEPTTGNDGYFELLVDTDNDHYSLEEDEQGRVDYKSIQVFTNVEAEQVLGSIYPPQKGLAGKTVTGKPIPAQLGDPARIKAGDGIELRENGTLVVATRAGRVTFENDTISISEEFVVGGDVDLKIGHINFNGFVEIKGDVLDDFNIKASKGISVSGAVGACTLEADGPVSIGTMAGMGTGLIRCRGNLTARYLNQATVECYGDVLVSSEVRNSVVKATGAVNVASGLITGGQTVALEGIEAKVFGSRSGVKTYLTSGVYFPETDRLNFLRSRLKSIAYQLKKIAETLPLLHRKPLEELRKPLREAIELRIGILTQRQVNLTQEREELSEELGAFKITEHSTASAKINAHSSLKEGVIVNLGEMSEVLRQEIKGPVTIIENTETGGIRQLPLSPLQISAEQLEEELRNQDPETSPKEASSP